MSLRRDHAAIRAAESNTNTETIKANTAIANASVRTVDNLAIGSIFAMLSAEPIKAIYESTARFALLPLAAACTWLFAFFAWVEAYYNNFAALLVAKASVKSVAAVAVTTAVVGSLVWVGFAVPGPIIFASALGLNTLFDLGSAIYYTVMAIRQNGTEQGEKNRVKAVDLWKAVLVGAMTTAAVIAVVIFAKPAAAALGIAAGALGAVFGAHKIYQLYQEKKQLPPAQRLSISYAPLDDPDKGAKNKMATTAALRINLSATKALAVEERTSARNTPDSGSSSSSSRSGSIVKASSNPIPIPVPDVPTNTRREFTDSGEGFDVTPKQERTYLLPSSSESAGLSF